MDADQIKYSQLWWKGPLWLEKNESSWNHLDAETVSDIPEQRILVAVAKIVNKTTIEFFSNLFSRFSKYIKLQRVVAYLLRYYSNLRSPLRDRQLGILTTSECRKALYLIVSVTQQEVFPQEFVTLKNNRSLDKSSKLLCLNPFMDAENRVIRVGGRISNANYKFDKIHPMILPAKHEITRLIFEREHERLLHCGPQQLLYSIRQQFWPLCGRNTSRLVVRKCVKCFRSNPEASQYIMGNLSSARLSQCFPFHKTGVDYAGPILIKDRTTRGAKLIKSYICLFICFSTKAMHLEVVTDLTSDAFLACLKRFVARRGKPEVIYSDNGSNFVGADAKLKELSKFIKDNAQTIINNASNDNIIWKFIPAKSPNFGGLWEAGVKSVKRHLTRVIGNAHLTYEEFTTVIIQIESVLNSRPLNPLSSDPTDFNPLTPSHFLIGRAMTAIPEPSVLHIQENRLNKYQRQHQILQHFWRRWHKEYISELQIRSKWKSPFNTSVQTGNLVVVKEDNQPPLKWTLGRITELHRGKDDVVRVVSVQIGKHIFKRPVTKICVLPINDNDNSVRKID